MANAYIFYGKAGAGKGTQAALLRSYLESQGHSVISAETGGLLREFYAGQGFLPAKIKQTMGEGKLTPVFMAAYVWAHALVQNFTGTEDVVFDGVARRIEEAPVLDSALSYLEFKHVHVFQLHIFDETAVVRMKARALASGAAARPDDLDEKAIKTRLDAYKNEVLPVVEYFERHPVYHLHEINGEESIDGVLEQIKRVITSYEK